MSDSDLSAIKLVNTFEKRLASAYLTVCILTGLSFCCCPLMLDLVNLLAYGTPFGYNTPYLKVLFFDYKFSPVYEFLYAMDCVGTFVILFISVSRFYYKK